MLFQPTQSQTEVLLKIYGGEVLAHVDWRSAKTLKEHGFIEWQGGRHKVTREGILLVERIQRRNGAP